MGTIILIFGFHTPYADGGLSQNIDKHLRFRFADICKGPVSFPMENCQAEMIGIISANSNLEREIEFGTADISCSIKISSFIPPNKKNLQEKN